MGIVISIPVKVLVDELLRIVSRSSDLLRIKWIAAFSLRVQKSLNRSAAEAENVPVAGKSTAKPADTIQSDKGEVIPIGNNLNARIKKYLQTPGNALKLNKTCKSLLERALKAAEKVHSFELGDISLDFGAL